MKVQYMKGVASHHGPESCAPAREGSRPDLGAWGRSVDRGSVGRDIEPRNQTFGVPTLLLERKATPDGALSRALPGPARSKTLCMRGSFMRENREISSSLAGFGSASRVGKAKAVIP